MDCRCLPRCQDSLSPCFRPFMNHVGKDDWQCCRPEIIQEVIGRSHRETRRGMLQRIGLTSAGLFSAIAGGTFWWASQKPTREDVIFKVTLPISCREVRQRLVVYHQANLDDGLHRRIRCHLSRCSPCMRYYEDLYPETADCRGCQPILRGLSNPVAHQS